MEEEDKPKDDQMNANPEMTNKHIDTYAVVRRLDVTWDASELDEHFESYVRLGDQVLGRGHGDGFVLLTMIED